MAKHLPLVLCMEDHQKMHLDTVVKAVLIVQISEKLQNIIFYFCINYIFYFDYYCYIKK